MLTSDEIKSFLSKFDCKNNIGNRYKFRVIIKEVVVCEIIIHSEQCVQLRMLVHLANLLASLGWLNLRGYFSRATLLSIEPWRQQTIGPIFDFRSTAICAQFHSISIWAKSNLINSFPFALRTLPLFVHSIIVFNLYNSVIKEYRLNR